MASERFVRAYVGALDLVAICVLGPVAEDQPIVLRAGRDVGAVVKQESARTGRPIAIKATRWLALQDDAELIIETCHAELPQLNAGWLAIEAPIARKAVEIVAGDLGFELETDATIRERAEATVRAVELQLDAMKARGDLRPVTKRYRAYRLARATEGKRAQPWCAWFANYKAELIRAAAIGGVAVGPRLPLRAA